VDQGGDDEPVRRVVGEIGAQNIQPAPQSDDVAPGDRPLHDGVATARRPTEQGDELGVGEYVATQFTADRFD